MRIFLAFVFSLTFSISLQAQADAAAIAAGQNGIPAVEVQTLAKEKVSTATFDNDGKPMLIVLWSTWAKPAILMLNTIMDRYESWQRETGVKIYAISVDDQRNAAKVKPFVEGKSWEYEIYQDPTSRTKSAFQWENVPYYMVVDGNKQVTHTGTQFSSGDEDKIFEHIRAASGGDENEE